MIPIRNLKRNLKKALLFPGYAFRALCLRGRSALSYYYGDGKSALPETISLLLTYRCNLRCKMCGQWGEVGSARHYTPEILKQELGIDDIRSLIDDVRGFSPTITLFGGEPLIYRDIVSVIEYIKSSGMRVNIITNGTFLSRYAKDLVRLGLDEIIFSLDGPADIHDRVRGRKGVFRDAEKGFSIVSEEKKRRGVKRPVVNVNSTIFDFNYEYLSETFKSAKAMGAMEVTFHHLIFLNRQIYDAHNRVMKKKFDTVSTDWEGFILDELPSIDPDRLIENLRKIRSYGASVYPNLTDKEVREYYTNFEFSPKSYPKRCMSPWMVAYIFPEGSVRPCLSQGVSLGNIREKSFREIWNGEGYRSYRREVKERGMFDACIRCTELYRF